MQVLPDKTVISARADIAPVNTVILECRMAIIAAMKNVLSPNSETTITESDATKACTSPRETVGVCFVVCSEGSESSTSAGSRSSFSSTGSELAMAVPIRTTHSTLDFANIILGVKLQQRSQLITITNIPKNGLGTCIKCQRFNRQGTNFT